MTDLTVKKEKVTPLFGVLRAILRPICKLVFWQTYLDRENVPASGRCIVCCNHISIIDPVFLVFGVKRQIHYMAKTEIFNNPITSWFFHAIGTFPVNRGSAVDTSAINNSMDILKDDRVMGIFPEGTRTKDGSIGRFKPGAVMLAAKENAPIVPAAIYIKTSKVKPFCRPVIIYGKPITVKDLGVDGDSSKQIRDASRILGDMVKELQQNAKERAD